MARNKLEKFAQLLTYPNVYENRNPVQPQLTGQGGAEVDMKGQWAEKHFKNKQPITLELACGRGEYTVALARRYPDRNFIGVDIKGARIFKGATFALEDNLTNAAFLRTRIEQISLFFAPGEIDEIWITFPDPFKENRKANRRMTGPRFLAGYRRFLAPEGIIHLKTDSQILYEYTLEVLEAEPDIILHHASADIDQAAYPTPELDIPTYYERKAREEGKPITYLSFSFKPIQTAVLPNDDN